MEEKIKALKIRVKMDLTYWYGRGKYQSKYREMVENDFEFTKTSEKQFRQYYRYYNDGDIPKWASYYDSPYKYDRDMLETELERRVNERIKKEYKRFEKVKEEQ